MSTLLNDQRSHSNRASPERSISQPPTVTSFINAPRLPRIDLPKFDGIFSDWLSFRDLFTSLVLSNGNISAVEKLQYLKTSLVGSASHLLKNIALTSDNFEKAWDLLIHAFYENKRLLVDSALHSLFSLKKLTRESASEMEALYTSIMQIHCTLETLKRPVQHWNDILVFNCVQRLDSESVKASGHLGSAKESPTWKQLSEFLMTLQAFEKSQSRPFLQSRIHFAHSHSASIGSSNAEPESTCVLCTDQHHLSRCPTYQQKTVQNRRQLVQQNRLCFNCLRRPLNVDAGTTRPYTRSQGQTHHRL